MTFVWSESNIARLKELHSLGFSASEIAREMGATSRSAVIGKLYRLNAPKRPKPPAKTVRLPRITEAEPAAARREMERRAREAAERDRRLSEAPLPTSGLVRVIDPRAGLTCRFPMWGIDFNWKQPDAPNKALYCGREKKPGSRYCHVHHRLMYTRKTEAE